MMILPSGLPFRSAQEELSFASTLPTVRALDSIHGPWGKMSKKSLSSMSNDLEHLGQKFLSRTVSSEIPHSKGPRSSGSEQRFPNALLFRSV